MFGFITSYFAPFGLSGSIVIVDGVGGEGIIGTGASRCGANGVVAHAPTQIAMRISGSYQSVLPDSQVATVNWDEGTTVIDFPSGAEAGFCNTILSANLLTIADASYVDWDLHDLSEAGNDIGHGLGQDALGLEQCNVRIYALFLKNRSDSLATMIIGGSSLNEWGGFLAPSAKITAPADSFFAYISEEPNGLDATIDDCNLKVASSGGVLKYGINFCASSG